MPEQDEPFTPQFVDEQIERFTSHLEQQPVIPEMELIADMRDLYRDYADTRDRVCRRLQEQMAQRSKTVQDEMGTVRSLPFEQSGPQRKNTMQAQAKSPVKTRTLKQNFTMLAAILCAALLVVVVATAAPSLYMRFANNTNNLSRPTSLPITAQSTFVYTANSSGVLKLNASNGTTLKVYPWSSKILTAQPGYTIQPFTLQTSGKLLFVGFKVINGSGHIIYGGVQVFDTSKDKMLWDFEGQTIQNTALTLSGRTVYLSVDHPDITGHSLIFALNAPDGRQLTSYNVPLAIEQLTVSAGFLYPLGYENFYGVNLTTKATWHITGSQGANQGFSDLHIANGVLYVSLYQGTGSSILALNPATGKELWRTQEIPGKIFNFTIVQNVAYFGTDQAPSDASGDNLGRLDAYDLGQHKLLWETAAPSVARTYAVSNGTLYIVTSFPYAGGAVDPQLMAFATSHGDVLWDVTAGAQDYSYAPVVASGRLYIATSATPQYPGRQLEMISQANGKTLWKKAFSSQIGGYVVMA